MRPDPEMSDAMQALTLEKERWRITLESIGDGVIATDSTGRVTFMNNVASKLTGWSRLEAEGRPIQEIFHIVNEKTGQEVESPVTRVIREGVIVGLANHTALISREGRSMPIADSGAPIRDSSGKLVGTILVFRDFSDERSHQRAQALLGEIVRNADDAIISKDLTGAITSWNPAAERIFGYSAAEAVGRSITMLIPADRLEEESVILSRLKRGERIEHFETVRQRKDGSFLDISLTVSPVKDEDGVVIGASKIARDVTEQTRSRRLLEEANRAKEQFIAMLSHELRTPLTPVSICTEILRRKIGNNRELADLLDVIDRNLQSEVRLIDSLLDYNRLAFNKADLVLKPGHIHESLERAVDTVLWRFEHKKQTLQRDLAASNDAVAMDSQRMEQVFWNLLDNASKFSPEASVIVIRTRNEAGFVSVTIKDSGVGIEGDPSRLFRPFEQENVETASKPGGLGLGLAICSQIIKLHHGKISARSPGRNQGATFEVQLPGLKH